MTDVPLPPFYTLHAFDSVGSTNDLACTMAEEGAPNGSVVLAREQTGGKGRQGRLWSSPPGNLYASLIMRDLPMDRPVAQLSFVTALAMGEAIASFLPQAGDLKLKWPNDILVGGAKICGILLESRSRDLSWVVIGTGVNIASHPTDAPYPVTSLERECGMKIAPEALLARYLESFSGWYDRWRREGFAPVRANWLNAAFGVGKDITVRTLKETLEGRFADMDADGALILELTGGATKTVTAGDVFFR